MKDMKRIQVLVTDRTINGKLSPVHHSGADMTDRVTDISRFRYHILHVYVCNHEIVSNI